MFSLLLNAVFHHSLMMIPQQEIPGTVPNAYVMRHPQSGSVEVWWSPCPSRECPDDAEIDIIVDQCYDHCLLLEQNPKIENIAPPTKAPIGPTEDNGEIDDLNFHLSKRKLKDIHNKNHPSSTTPLAATAMTTTPTTMTTTIPTTTTYLREF